MIIQSIVGDQTIYFGIKQSRFEELQGQIAMDTLLLQYEEEHGFKNVYDRIEELKSKLEKNKKELKQLEESKKIRSRKTSKWNWR